MRRMVDTVPAGSTLGSVRWQKANWQVTNRCAVIENVLCCAVLCYARRCCVGLTDLCECYGTSSKQAAGPPDMEQCLLSGRALTPSLTERPLHLRPRSLSHTCFACD